MATTGLRDTAQTNDATPLDQAHYSVTEMAKRYEQLTNELQNEIAHLREQIRRYESQATELVAFANGKGGDGLITATEPANVAKAPWAYRPD